MASGTAFVRRPVGDAAAIPPFASPVAEPQQRRLRPSRAAERGAGRRAGSARAAIRTQSRPAGRGMAAEPDRAPAAKTARRPWYEVANAQRVAAGQRDCGPLERILHRQWAPGTAPPREAARAIDRLAALPVTVSQRLADGLEAIFVGVGGVPDLDHMGRLRGVPLPTGRATWDACAGAYGERKIIIGTRPSSAPDVVCHEVGHALDDLDGSGALWQSDSDEFRGLYVRCLPRLVSDFHKQTGSLGRREFFADSFAAIASGQRPALVDMLGGDIRTALDVMLYFNVRYGI
ncbi:MAG TPA: hypothetical protein VGS19_09650 [Streptosporangiaceae bacterium]|nr:hypothetical protein [Streptosporangiaceae bacterium]